MTCYAAFLGSINVGGNQLKMDALRKVMTEAGFQNVETVIASGNVLFEADAAPDEVMERRIAKAIKDGFGLTTFAAVRTRAEVEAAIKSNPFHGRGEDKFVHTHFADGALTQEAFDRLLADHKGRERLARGDRALFVDYVDGVGESKLTKAFIEKRLGRRATARNMRSLARILAKMDAR